MRADNFGVPGSTARVSFEFGEQVVLNKEIFAQGEVDDDMVFAYQERFAEYRYKPSQITGLFRSNAVASCVG